MTKLIKSDTTKLIIALIAGAVFGGVMKMFPPWFYVDDIIVNGVFKLFGNGFIELIKMTVMPLIFVSLVCGISSFGDTKKLGSVGVKTLSVFFVTTLISIIIAVTFSFILKPGVGLNMSVAVSQGNEYIPQNAKNIIDIMLDIIPSNPIKAMSKGNLLQVLVFAAFFGVSLGSIGERAQPIIKMFHVVNDCIMKIVSTIMVIAPIGVFALISNTVYSIGFESLIGILKMSIVVIISLATQAFIVYGLLYKMTNLSFKKFLKDYTQIAGIAFSTSSSNSTIPFSMNMMENMGVNKSIYQFVLPIGSTINMAGTAIMQGVSSVFIAQAYGLPLSIQSIITITITAVFASVGAAGVPGVGMIMMAMVLESVGLPVEGIALIIGFDRILDMARTVVNVMGDCVCAVVVAKSENDIDMEKYNSHT